jgi:hypothetical protein
MENLPPDGLASFSLLSSAVSPVRRTEWAERYVEDFLSLPFFAEFVFRDVQTTERGKSEQVADFLIFHRGTGILIEQKFQENPTARTGQKIDLWARKQAKEGWSQLRRAFTRSRNFPVWCDHPRQGRVEFQDGLPPIRHAIVALEVRRPVDLNPIAGELPLDHYGIPISYLALNDLLNLAILLRSIPELTDYLSARRSLSAADLRQIGGEEALFSFYLLNEGSFVGCSGINDARLAVAADKERLNSALERKFEADQYAHLMEYVADELATRLPNYAEGVPDPLLRAYDPPDRRQNYLEVQAALSDLRLRERSELGRVFHGTIERLGEVDRGFTFRAVRFDSMPDWVYVVGAAKNIDRAELLSKIIELMGGAMAFYKKSKCLVMVDREGTGYELALSRPGVRPKPEHVEAGRRLFGNLRTTTIPLNFLPHGET